jgi:hypothetical protein
VAELQARIEAVLTDGKLPDPQAVGTRAAPISTESVSTLTASPSFALQQKAGRSVRLGRVLLIVLVLSLIATWIALDGGPGTQADDHNPETAPEQRLPEANEPRRALTPAPRARSESHGDLAPAALKAPEAEPAAQAATTASRLPRPSAERGRDIRSAPTPEATPSAVLRTIETRH